MRWLRGLAILLIVLGLLPMIGLAAKMAIAAAGGCSVRDGFAYPCMIGGSDWGNVLRLLEIGGRALFLTAPIALAGMVLAISLAVLALIRRAGD